MLTLRMAIPKSGEAVLRLRPGRPRSEEANDRILQTAMTVIREVGVARMSVDEVALRARVSKPTIYRRWPSKTELAVAAIVEACRPEGPPLSGRPLYDAINLLVYFRAHFEARIQLPTLGSILQESNKNPDLLEAFRDSAIRRLRQHLQKLIEAAQSKKLIRSDGSSGAIVEMLIGAYYARSVVGDAFPSNWPVGLLKESGLLTKNGQSTIEVLARRGFSSDQGSANRKPARK